MNAKLIATGLVLVFVSCSSEQAPPTPRVENPALGIAFAALPDTLQIAVNEGTALHLAREGETDPLGVTVEVGPIETAGINLVEAVRQEKSAFEGLPGGVFFGSQELIGPTGAAYWSRGQYQEGDLELEETRILTLHPNENRQLALRSRYPAGDDSKQRVEELLLLLGYLEAIEPAEGDPASETAP